MKAFNLAVNLVGNPLNCFFPSNSYQRNGYEFRDKTNNAFDLSSFSRQERLQFLVN